MLRIHPEEVERLTPSTWAHLMSDEQPEPLTDEVPDHPGTDEPHRVSGWRGSPDPLTLSTPGT